MMEIEATYRVVTPLFCAGADPNRVELRLPSFKGALRFWWRALAWPRCGGDLRDIQRQEDALFGSAGGGQSRLLMRLAPVARAQAIGEGKVLTVSSIDRSVVGEGARYLGYGVMEAFASPKKKTEAGQLTRACLRARFDFVVRSRGHALDEQQLSSIRQALIALGTLGGMGARSRKGYGSLVLRSLRMGGVVQWESPQDVAGLKKEIAALSVNQESIAFPSFTAISNQTRHLLLSSNKKEHLELLDLVGRELVRYRSWGHNGKILDGKFNSEKNFKDDHDLMKKNVSERHVHPRRVAFGLPHNYGKRNTQQIGPHGRQLDRRAGPLFIHIHECKDSPIAVLSFLPAWFLPKGRSGISVGGHKVEQKPEGELYRPIHDFLDRLLDSGKRKEPFTDVIEVGP